MNTRRTGMRKNVSGSNPSSWSPGKPLFLANRTDGLGERLRAILNAMLMAEVSGGSFKFSWSDVERDYHDLRPVLENFSKEFCDKHYINAEAADKLRCFPLKEISNGIATGAFRYNLGDAIEVAQTDLYSQAGPILGNSFDPKDFSSIFERVGFSEKLQRVRSIVNSVNIPENSVAIHLRGGDIVYGNYRFTSKFYSKVIPLPIAAGIIKAAQEKGRTVILFSQDKIAAQYLEQTYDCMPSEDFQTEHDFDNLQKTFFDMTLMARCSHIFSGTSGFAGVATLISQGKRMDPVKYFGLDKCLDLIEEMVFDTSVPESLKPQMAFSCWYSFVISEEVLPTSDRLRALLRRGVEHDPTNDFYRFVLACDLAQGTNYSEAEKIFESILREESGTVGSVGLILRRKSSRQNRKYIPILKSMADQSYPMASLCAAICEDAFGFTESAAKYVQVYALNRKSSLSWGNRMIKRYPISGDTK